MNSSTISACFEAANSLEKLGSLEKSRAAALSYSCVVLLDPGQYWTLSHVSELKWCDSWLLICFVPPSPPNAMLN